MSCAGALVSDAEGRLLLVLRAHPPAAGTWSLPGGRVEPGETPAQTAVREVREETGLHVETTGLVGRVEWPGPGTSSYQIDDFRCRVVGGELHAGSDAAAARFVDAAELAGLSLSPLLLETLRSWGEVSD